MKTNLTSAVSVRQVKRNRRSRLLTVLVCLAGVLGMQIPVMAQGSGTYTVYAGQKPGATSTEVTVWFYDVVNSTNYAITSAEPGVSITEGGNGVVSGAEGSKTFKVTLNGGQLSPGDHTFTLVMTNDNCEYAQDFVVRVMGLPVLTLPVLGDVCNVADNVSVGGTITGTDGAAAVKYIWTAVQAAGSEVSGVTFASGNAMTELAYTAGTPLITGSVVNGAKQPVSIKYTVTPVAYYETDPGEQLKVTGEAKEVTLKVYPTVSFTSDLAYDVCSNTEKSYTATSDITGATVSYAWTRAAVSGVSNPLASGVTAGFTETLVNTTDAPVEVTYVYTLSMDGKCSSDFNVRATVNPTPVMTPVSIAAICSGDEVAYTPAANVAGTTYSWSRAAVTGITETAATGTGAIAETLSNTTNAPVEVTYKYKPVANTCTGAEADVKVWVNPALDLNLPADLTVCNGTTLDLAITSGLSTAGGETNQVTWTAVASAATLTGAAPLDARTDVAGLKITDKLQNTGTGLNTVTYAVTQYYTAHGKACMSAAPEEVVVTVVPKIEVTAASQPIVCSESPVNEVTFSTNLDHGLAVTYAWDFQYKPSELEVTGGTSSNVGADLNKVSGTGNFELTLVKNKNTNMTAVVTPVHVEASYTVAEGNVCHGENVFHVTVNPKPSFKLGKRP